MKDESYRDFIVTKLNRGLNRKISPDDRIDDVASCPNFETMFYFNIVLFDRIF